jgi:hypothetical protein
LGDPQSAERFQKSIKVRRVQRSKSITLDFGNGVSDRFVGRRMHSRIDRKRIV